MYFVLTAVCTSEFSLSAAGVGRVCYLVISYCLLLSDHVRIKKMHVIISDFTYSSAEKTFMLISGSLVDFS